MNASLLDIGMLADNSGPAHLSVHLKKRRKKPPYCDSEYLNDVFDSCVEMVYWTGAFSARWHAAAQQPLLTQERWHVEAAMLVPLPQTQVKCRRKTCRIDGTVQMSPRVLRSQCQEEWGFLQCDFDFSPALLAPLHAMPTRLLSHPSQSCSVEWWEGLGWALAWR